MIGGVDLVLRGRTRSDDADFILRAIRGFWPLAQIQRADAERAVPLSTIRFPVTEMSEFFAYRDGASAESWQRDGACSGNEDSMIHVIICNHDATMVVDTGDGPLATAVREILDGLRAKRLIPRRVYGVQEVRQ